MSNRRSFVETFPPYPDPKRMSSQPLIDLQCPGDVPIASEEPDLDDPPTNGEGDTADVLLRLSSRESQDAMAMLSNKDEHMVVHSHTTRTVIVHVTFLKIGEINTLKEQFDADILLRCKWREPELDREPGKAEDGQVAISLPHTQIVEVKTSAEMSVDWGSLWDPKVYIENTCGEPKITTSRQVEYNDRGEAFVLERRRVRGTFMETLELWEFPFDVQDLSVTIMSDMPSDEVELVEDPDEIHKIYKQSFIDEQEWYLYKFIESEKKDLQKDLADPTIRRSALTVKCRAARRPAYFIWNIFSVTMLISCLAFVTFAVENNLVQNRLQLTFTLVLTSVAFKFVVNQSLPRISYLTYLDRYVFATVMVLALVCFYHGLQTLLDKDKYPTKDYYALAILIGLYILYNIQFVLRILLIPYRKRRQMKHLEAQYIAIVQEQAQKRKPTKKHHGFRFRRNHNKGASKDTKAKELDVAATAV